MNENIGVVIFSEKRNSKTVKINHKSVNRDFLYRRLKANDKGNQEVTRAAKDVKYYAVLIILHYDYKTVSIMQSTKGEYKNYESLDIFYTILDAVNEQYESDILISKNAWNDELEAIDNLKTEKIPKESIGVYECLKAEQYGKKDVLQGLELTEQDLKEKIINIDGKLPITLMLMLVNISKIKKVFFWKDYFIIGIVHRDNIKYAIELNEKSYNKIKNTVTGTQL